MLPICKSEFAVNQMKTAYFMKNVRKSFEKMVVHFTV